MCAHTKYNIFTYICIYTQIIMTKSALELAVSVDIGGTNIKMGIVTSEGKIIKKDSIKTSGIGNENHFFYTLSKRIKLLLSDLTFDNKVKGIGIGVPGVSKNNREIHYAANLDFLENVDIVSKLQKKMKTPVFYIKDSNAAALGEGLLGAAKGMKDYILLTLGTGLGCSIFVNNQILKGSTGLAGEFGHSIVKEGGRACTCGRFGCLETYVSGSGIVRTVIELLANTRHESDFRNQKTIEITPKSIFEAAKKGDKIALQAFDLTGKILGIQLSNLLTIFDPEAIILAGGLVNASDFLLPSIIYHLENNTLTFYKGNTKVLISSLKANDAALIGAATLVWNNKNVNYYDKN